MINTAVTFEYGPFREYLQDFLSVGRTRGLPPSVEWKMQEGNPSFTLQEQQAILTVVATDMIESYLDNFVWCAGQTEELKEDEDPMVRLLYHLERYTRQAYPHCQPVLFYPLDLKGMVLAVITGNP